MASVQDHVPDDVLAAMPLAIFVAMQAALRNGSNAAWDEQTNEVIIRRVRDDSVRLLRRAGWCIYGASRRPSRLQAYAAWAPDGVTHLPF